MYIYICRCKCVYVYTHVIYIYTSGCWPGQHREDLSPPYLHVYSSLACRGEGSADMSHGVSYAWVSVIMFSCGNDMSVHMVT